MKITDSNLKSFKLQDDDADIEEPCEECGEKLSKDGVCPVCSPKDDGADVDADKEFE